MTKKISYDELKRMIMDPSVSDRDLRPYFTGEPGNGRPFTPNIIPNPETVSIDPATLQLENALSIGNGFSRFRRERTFERRIDRNDPRPVLVSEGDSWFQFPFLIDDVIDHLLENYTIRSLGAAGDTARNIVATGEYLTALRENTHRVKAFLFSAAGNDVIGTDEAGNPEITKLLHRRRGSESAAELINRDNLAETITFLRDKYTEVIEKVHAEPGLETLPIILHGYDYCFPGAEDDRRDPIWADPDEWLGKPLRDLDIDDPILQRDIVKILIDELYQMLQGLTTTHHHVHVVDVRGTLSRAEDWADEIHGTNDGFARVAGLFEQTIEALLPPSRGSGTSRVTRRNFEAASAPHNVDASSRVNPAVIVLDPGHGGHASVGGSSPNNATGPNGVLEKDLTLQIGKLAETILEDRGHRVFMTRASDRNPSLAKRAQVARDNEANVFVSIHFNGWHDPRVQGTETYHHNQAEPASQLLASSVQSKLLAATNLRDRGVKSASFGVLRPSRHHSQTAACLAEISFLTDPLEEQRLQNADYQHRIGQALADGIEDYLIETQTFETAFLNLESQPDADYGDAIEVPFEVELSSANVETPATPPKLSRAPKLTVDSELDMPRVSSIANPERFLNAWRTLRRNNNTLESRLEAKIGRDDTVPFVFFEQGVARGKAVCKINTTGIDHQGRPGSWFGTGFLVAPNLLLTNHHVINSEDVARRARVQFNYQLEAEGEVNKGEFFSLDPDALFITSPAIGGLDYTFVSIKNEPHLKYGYIAMERGMFTIAPEERANIIHHPDGRPKRISLQDNQIRDFHKILLHYASDTESGSSGSPVFDNTWRLIALHHAWDYLPADTASPDGSASRMINEGIKISAITVDLETRVNDEVAGPAAQSVLQHISGSDSLTGFFGANGRRPHAANSLEAVVDIYEGTPQDIDVAFWNVEWFNRRFRDRVGAIARVIADLNLDIWAFAEASPEATEALVEYLNEYFGHKFEWAPSEPDASSGKQTTTVIWNPMTVKGRRMDWPDEIEPLLRADSRDVPDLRFEAVEGKVFNRYPGLFRFEALNRTETSTAPFNFNLVPLHLKAKAEGAKRRRLASQILSAVVSRMINHHGADRDWLIGGDINAELATGQFNALSDAGFLAMGSEDEAAAAISYLKGPKSLIDNIFLSPNLAKLFGADDFFIYAGDAKIPDYVKNLSDHRPVMARLSLADHQPSSTTPPKQPQQPSEPGENWPDKEAALLDYIIDKAKRDPEDLLRDLADRLKQR